MITAEAVNLPKPASTRAQRVIAQVAGGLGNQPFMYAAAFALERCLNARLEMDSISGFCRDHVYKREYLLDQFAITAPTMPPRECFVGLSGRLRRFQMRKAESFGLAESRWAFVAKRSLAAYDPFVTGRCERSWHRGSATVARSWNGVWRFRRKSPGPTNSTADGSRAAGTTWMTSGLTSLFDEAVWSTLPPSPLLK